MKSYKLIVTLILMSNLLFAQTAAIQWLAASEGGGQNIGTSIATDENFVYATGYFTDTCTLGDTTLVSKGSWDFYLTKLDKHGNYLWIKQFGGSGQDRSNDLHYHEQHIYITGFFEDTLLFDDAMLISASSHDAFLLDISSDGTVNRSMQIGGSGKDQGYTIDTDSENNIYLSGIFQDSLMIGDYSMQSKGDYDIFTAKYNEAGNVLWANQAGGTGQVIVSSSAVDEYNNVYISGSFEESASFADTSLVSSGFQDIFIVKYNHLGQQIWVHKSGGEWGARTDAMAVDKNGNLFVTGIFGGTAFFGDDSITAVGLNDVFLAGFNHTGELQWIDNWGSIGYDQVSDLTVDSDYIYLAVYFEDQTVLPDTTLQNRSAQLMQLTKAGVLVDLIQAGNYYHNKCILDKSSALFVTGGFGNNPVLFGDSLIFSESMANQGFVLRINYLHTSQEELYLPEESLTVYPNPASQIVTILHNESAFITLFNIEGQMIQQEYLSKDTGKTMMDISNLKPGLYIIFLQYEKQVLSTKLMVF